MAYLFNLVKIFNVQYYLCICPFRVRIKPHKKSRNTGSEFEYTFEHGPWPQKIACAIVHALIQYESVCTAIKSWNEYVQNEAGLSFHLTVGLDIVVAPFYRLSYMNMCWSCGRSLQKLFEVLPRLEGKKSENGKNFKIVQCCVLLWVLFVIILFEWKQRTWPDLNAGPGDILRSFYNEGVKTYVLLRPGDENPLDILGIFATTLHLFVCFEAAMLAYCALPAQILVTLFLNKLMDNFKDFYENRADTNSKFREVLIVYEHVKFVVKQTNEIFGPVYVASIILSLLYFPSFIGTIFESWDFSRVLSSVVIITSMALFFLGVFVLLYFGARVNSKACKFYEWIASQVNQYGTPYPYQGSWACDGEFWRSRPGIHCINMAALRMDMSTNQLAMKGNGLFVFTTSFGITFLGSVLTYTIIIWQFQSSASAAATAGGK